MHTSPAANTGTVSAQNEDSIIKAHERSQAFGVAAADDPDFSSLTHIQLERALDENRLLLDHAFPAMQTLYGQIANTGNVVVLSSAQGVLLHTLGDTDFEEKASKVALLPGVDWSERTKGTNAIGTALSELQPVTVHGKQHYLAANMSLACSCAPIFDPEGGLLGALDVTGDYRSHHPHTLALVRMSVQMMENRMLENSFPKAIQLRFHAGAEFLGTLAEGLVAFTRDGRFLSANRCAQFQLGMSLNALKAHTFSSLFDLPISALVDLFGNAPTAPKQLCMHNGVNVWCQADIRPTSPWIAPLFSAMQDSSATGSPAQPTKTPSPEEVVVTRSRSDARRRASALDELDTGDKQIHSVIHKLRKVANHDIPVLILGETGTGKDLMARAIHDDSQRANKPFVPVNCASIPDTLIEAELFGYEEGAFTGARKKGSPGKILQAHGGTLFLDEIGDMPPHLQARLLRVLQERKVSPLGSANELHVDIYVVSATHKNLKEMIAHGQFREDLYYRLNGMVVQLPALRDRSDFEPLVHKILQSLSKTGPAVAVSRDVMALLRCHHWPGNLRQLHNLLRTAVVMARDDGCIEREHLPDDFLMDVSRAVAPRVETDVESPHPHPAATPSEPLPHPDADNQRLQDVTLQTMVQILRQHKGNISAAAKALGVSRNTIYRKKHLLPQGLID